MDSILTAKAQNCMRRAMGMDELDDLEDIDLSYCFKESKRYNHSGMFNGFHRQKHSSASKSIMSDKKKGLFQAKDSKGNSVGLVSQTHPKVISGEYTHINKGMKHTEEFKKLRSKEWKKRGIKPPSAKGLLWWNNGVTRKRSATCPGKGWVRGRLYGV